MVDMLYLALFLALITMLVSETTRWATVAVLVVAFELAVRAVPFLLALLVLRACF